MQVLQIVVWPALLHVQCANLLLPATNALQGTILLQTRVACLVKVIVDRAIRLLNACPVETNFICQALLAHYAQVKYLIAQAASIQLTAQIAQLDTNWHQILYHV